jgi:hypothetical protein
MPNVVQATGKAGELFIPALGRTIRQVEWREDDIYDTVVVTGAAQTPGTSYDFFSTNLDTKRGQHSNVRTQRRIASDNELVMFRAGLHPRGYMGNALAVFADIHKVAENAIFRLLLGDRLVTEGPMIKYQSGYGLSGFSGAATTVAATTINNSPVSVGVPSQAAAPVLLVPQEINSQDELNGSLRFESAAWVSGYADTTPSAIVGVSCFLHGFIKKPLGK